MATFDRKNLVHRIEKHGTEIFRILIPCTFILVSKKDIAYWARNEIICLSEKYQFFFSAVIPKEVRNLITQKNIELTDFSIRLK